MIGAVPPDYAATFFGVIDEDAALAAADAERVSEQAEFEQDSRAELEGVDEVGEEVVRAAEEEESDHWSDNISGCSADDTHQLMELERCLYLADAATCRARMFCLILAKRAASGGGSMDSSLPAELWLHCAVMCPVTTVQKWVRCRFAEWVVASDENWHNGYDGLLNEYQLALRNHRNGATDLKRQARKPRQPITANARLMELESVLSHDEWEPVEDRDWLWADLAELLASHPHLRTILNVPEEATAEAEIRQRFNAAFFPLARYFRHEPPRMLQEHVGALATLSDVIDKWEHAERIVTRRSWGKVAHWDARCEVPHFANLLLRDAWPLFNDEVVTVGDDHSHVEMLGCMCEGFPADMNAATAEYYFIGCFEDHGQVHCSLAGLFAVDWDVSCASTEHSGGEELHSTDSGVGTHPTRRQLVGDEFCAGLAALERQIVGADLSPADFRFLFCFDDWH